MSESREHENLDDLSASDDDAPEEVGVAASKIQRLSQAKMFHDQERLSKEAEKERRRKRNEMFKLQKEKKLENINKRVLELPRDVLEAVSSKSAKLSDEVSEETANLEKHGDADPDTSDEDQGDRLSDSGVEDDSNVNEDDYIPLSSSTHGSLNVVTLQSFTKKKKSASESALEFRNSRLFGSGCAPRESAKQRQAKRQKKMFK